MLKWFSNLFAAPDNAARIAVDVPPDMPLLLWREDSAFPIPRGQAFRRELAAKALLPPQAYWRAFYQSWFVALGAALQNSSEHGHDYTWAWHQDFLLLSPLGNRRTEVLARYCKQAAARIMRALPGLAQMNSDGALPIIVFPDADSYGAYTDHLYSEDEPGIASAGLFMKLVDDAPSDPDAAAKHATSQNVAGFGHFILLADEIDEAEPTLVHEMTHALLSHLELPLWIEEGIATAMEHTVSQGSADPSYVLNHRSDLQRRHGRYWNAQTKKGFWDGSAFSNGTTTELAYDMAHLIVSELGRDFPRFAAFAKAASVHDGGAEAARSIYGLPLDAFVDSYLEVWR